MAFWQMNADGEIGGTPVRRTSTTANDLSSAEVVTLARMAAINFVEQGKRPDYRKVKRRYLESGGKADDWDRCKEEITSMLQGEMFHEGVAQQESKGVVVTKAKASAERRMSAKIPPAPEIHRNVSTHSMPDRDGSKKTRLKRSNTAGVRITTRRRGVSDVGAFGPLKLTSVQPSSTSHRRGQLRVGCGLVRCG